MHDAHGGGDLVHVLPAGAAGVEDVYPQVLGSDVHVHLVRLRQHGDRSGRGVDAPLRLGHGHALYAMHAALMLQETVSVRSLDLADHLFQPALFGLARVDDVHAQPVALCVPLVHAEEVAREERSLVPSGPAADLHDHVLAVVRVLGQQRLTQFLVQPLHFGIEALSLLHGQRRDLRVIIGGEFFRFGQFILSDLEPLEGVHHRQQSGTLPAQPRELGRIGNDFRRSKERVYLLTALQQIIEPFEHGRCSQDGTPGGPGT